MHVLRVCTYVCMYCMSAFDGLFTQILGGEQEALRTAAVEFLKEKVNFVCV